MSSAAFVTDYAAACAKIEADQAAQVATPGFNPALHSLLLTHGAKTRRAVLWFHGYTSAPPQFRRLAELCYARGDNVCVPCVPHHGFKDRQSPELSRVNGRELVQFINETVDRMHGLGEEVVVGGLSMGGAMASWVAQFRADVAQAVIVSPFLGAYTIPTRWTFAAAKAVRLLPDQRDWWDPERKADCLGPDYGYVKRSTHSIGEIFRLGEQVFAAARRRPPAVQRVWMVVNDNDRSVNNEMIQRLVNDWRARGAQHIETYHFPADLGLPHDCISVEAPNNQPELVYAELLRMLN